MIQIDVHPVGENSINTTRTIPTKSPYVTTFHWLPRSRNKPLHPEEVLATKDRLAQPSSWVASFLLPCDSPAVGERGFSPTVTQLHQLTRPIYQHAIGTFNACSRGPTHRFLIDTGGGYNLGGADFPHTTRWPFQPTVSTFHLRAPPDLRLNNPTLPKDLERGQTLNLVSGSLHSTSTVSYHLSIVCANGNHQVIG